MFCKNCGEKLNNKNKFCTNCGTSFSDLQESSIGKNMRKWDKGKIAKISIAVVVILWIIYANADDGAITSNNEGVRNYDSGNTKQAIEQLRSASDSAVSDSTKINTLKNLGYIYTGEGNSGLAISSFKEALVLAKAGSFDYYLISGEVALLEGKPNSAQLSYSRAYEIDPNDFQINNALNLFYLDLEEVAPNYVNYSKALSYAKKAYEVSGPEIKNIATQNLGIAHVLNENLNQAISLLSPYSGKDPYVDLWIGVAYLKKEDHANARFYFQKSLNGGADLPQEILDYLNS